MNLRWLQKELPLQDQGGLEMFRDQVYSCTRCASCVAVCPTYLATGEEALSARGRISLIEAVLDGRLGLTRGLAERLSKCLECGACATSCPSGIDVPGAIHAMRVELARNGSNRLARGAARTLGGLKPGTGQWLLHSCAAAYRTLPKLPMTPWLENGSRRRLPGTAGRPLDALLPEISPAVNATRRISFFPGCATSLAYQHTALAAVRVLNRAGVDVVLPPGLGCCGQPYRTMGEADTASVLLRRSLRALGAGKPDAIVTVCASCALMLREGMMGAGEDRGAVLIPVLDIHELLAETGLPSPAPAHGPSRRITWHDPCHMKRGLGLIHEPREIIGGLSGIEYSEADGSSCCGGAGSFSLSHYPLAVRIGLERAEELTATGARVIVTGCPGCRIQLEDMLARMNSKVVVRHTVELLDETYPAPCV